MQIHEITKSRAQPLEEDLASAAGAGVGRAVSGVKNVASFVASPFKDIGQGYKTARMDQKTAALADKMYRAWQQYSVQWAKSQGGSYTKPGTGGAAATQTSQPGAVGTGGTAAKSAAGAVAPKTKTTKTKAQDLFSTIQALDDRQLAGIVKVLNQRVGPAATMAALKKPEPVAPGQLNELGWQDVKNTASNIGTQIKQGVQMAPQLARQVGQGYKKAAQTGMKAVKAAPGAIATGAGATAGAIAGMPARAQTAYRTGKQYVSGPKMTMTELQTALQGLSTTEAQKLLTYVQQIQQMRKAGIKEGLNPPELVKGWEQALRAFVQKNMLAGMQYSRLQNVQQIDGLIKQIVDPANDSEGAQRDLWNKLTLASAIAQHNPAQAGGETPGKDSPTPTTATGSESAAELKDAMGPILTQLGQDKNVATVGQAVRKTFTNNSPDIKSTGVPAVDAMLMTMGFRPA